MAQMSIHSIIYQISSNRPIVPALTEPVVAAMKACGIERVKVMSEHNLLAEIYEIGVCGDYTQDIAEHDMIERVRAELYKAGHSELS